MAKSGAIGAVRKVHLKPRAGDVERDRIGDQKRNALALGDRGRDQRHRGMIGAEHRDDLVLGDQPQRLALADRRIALMVGLIELDLGAAEIGQAGGRGERQPLELGMRAVDDLGAELDGVLGRLAGARGIAGQRIDHADLDVGRLGRDRHHDGDCGSNAAAAKPHIALFISLLPGRPAGAMTGRI